MPLLLIGDDERIRAANPQAEGLFGPNLVGRHFFTVVRQPDVLDCIAQSLETGNAGETRLEINDHAQDSVFRVIAAPVLADLDATATDATEARATSAEPRAVLASFEDITSLEAAGRMRRDFVANVSHELRTPLTAILGFIETLRGPARDDAAARERFLETMEREAVRMNRLVVDLLSLSRVEQEERVRPTERVELDGILDSVCRSLRPLAEEAGMRLDVIRDPGPVAVLGDADQLMQVFNNLVMNAIKYASEGGAAELRLIPVGRDPVLRTPAVQIDVRDFGPGIDDIHLHRLTERFYRADSHRARELGGTGLGLAIVKHIVARHRGRLKIQSAVGQGSCFSVMLPRPSA